MPNNTSVVFEGGSLLYQGTPDESTIDIDLKNIREICFRKHEITLLEKLRTDMGFVANYDSLIKIITTVSVELYSNLINEGHLKKTDDLALLISNVENAVSERIKFHKHIINVLSVRTTHVALR